MRFETKIAVVVREDLAAWQKLNLTAFLASAVAAGVPETIGEAYQDGSGTKYLAMFRQPVLVYAADQAGLARAHRRALSRDLAIAVFTVEMFQTDHDAANRAVVRAVATDQLRLAGIAMWGGRTSVEKAVDRLRLHP